MNLTKLIFLLLFFVVNTTCKKKVVFAPYSIKKIKPIKHYKNPPPWKVYSEKDIINKTFKR